MTEKILQRKYLQMQLLKQQLNALIEEKNILDDKITEIVITIDALKKLENVKKGEEIWSTLGSGAFIRSDIKDIDTVLISVGAGVVIRERREKAIEILEGRLNELNAIDKEFVAEINKYNQQINKLETEIQNLVPKQVQTNGNAG